MRVCGGMVSLYAVVGLLYVAGMGVRHGAFVGVGCAGVSLVGCAGVISGKLLLFLQSKNHVLLCLFILI